MSVNKREEILDRLFAILGTISGFVTVDRNRGLRKNDEFPAAFLLDGDETSRNVPSGRGRPGMSTVIPVMQPQIFVLLKNRKPGNTNVGTDLNQYRGVVIKAIAADAQLLALIGPNGEITYDGCETDLKTGAMMEGQMQLNFSISSVMNPNA